MRGNLSNKLMTYLTIAMMAVVLCACGPDTHVNLHSETRTDTEAFINEISTTSIVDEGFFVI